MTRIRTAERRASFEQGCRQMTASKLERYSLPLNEVLGPTGVTGNVAGRQPVGMNGAEASAALTSREDDAVPADGIAAKDAVPTTSGNHARRKRLRQTFMGYRDPKERHKNNKRTTATYQLAEFRLHHFSAFSLPLALTRPVAVP